MMITMIKTMLIKIILPLVLGTCPKGEAAAEQLRSVTEAGKGSHDISK
jgi:hypothetical protein